MDQKTEDMHAELELKKKLSPLLESHAERKRWEKEQKEEAAKEQGGTDIRGALAKAMKEMEIFDREMKRREAAERAGLEYVPKKGEPGEDDSDNDSDNGDTTASPNTSPLPGKRKIGPKKESLKSRIKALEAAIAVVTNPARWRACDNLLDFPHDIQASAASLILPSLALHIRVGCSGRKYKCKWCDELVMQTGEEQHMKNECRESNDVCSQCNGPVKRRLMKRHMKKECLARPWVFCPNDCEKEMKSSDLRKHMKLECPNRKKRCKFCKEIVLFQHYELHLVSDCSDRIAPCVVQGCDRTFHEKSDHYLVEMHQHAHLQKEVKRWTMGEVAYWLEMTFPFFGDFLLLQYKRAIVEKNITGKKLLKPSSAKELRRLLMKNIGMPEDHAYTVTEAVVGRAPADERWAEHPKKLRAGAYLSQDIRSGVRENSSSTSPYKMKLVEMLLEDHPGLG
jgi:hypothetical protein